jgi:hypothetical protein
VARWNLDQAEGNGFKLLGNRLVKQSRKTLDEDSGSVQEAIAQSKYAKMRSNFEKSIARRLELLGIKFEYETKHIEYTTTAKYTPDFVIGDKLIESKGWFRPADRKKMLAVKAQHPDLKLCLLFQDASKTLTKKSKTTYAQWCQKNNFPWAEGRQWLKSGE